MAGSMAERIAEAQRRSSQVDSIKEEEEFNQLVTEAQQADVEEEEAQSSRQETEEPVTKKEKTDQSEDDAQSEGSQQAAEQKSEDDDGNESLTVEERLELLEKELELRDLKLERMSEKAKHFESLAGKHAGELDYLRKNSASRTERKADDGDLWSELLEDDDQETDDGGTKRRASSVDLTEFEQDALDNTRQQAAIQFMTTHEDLYYETEDGQKDVHPDFVKILEEVRDSYKEELFSASPKRVRKATEAVLKEARLAFRERQVEQSLSEARKKRAIVSQKARERKLATQASQSSASTSTSINTAKSIEDMTDEELAELINNDPQRTRYRRM